MEGWFSGDILHFKIQYMETLKKVLLLIILALFTFWIAVKLNSFNSSKSQFVEFEEVLFPLKKNLDPKTKVSFYNPDDITEFFYRAQFNLAPVIIERNSTNDTLIFFCENVKMHYTDTSFMVNYQKHAYYKNERFTAVLLIKQQ